MQKGNLKLERDYKKRLTIVFEYIADHLDEDLSLNRIADVAHFSPFHFHRVFKYLTGERLNQYINRQRVEKAALALLHKDWPMTEIADRYGFGNPTSFSRAFKKFYNQSPTTFRKSNLPTYSKIGQVEGKNSQDQESYERYFSIINHLKNWINMNAKIEVKEMPKMNLAFITTIGIHNLSSNYERLVKWATPKGLINDKTKMITVYHDSLKITEPGKARMSAAVLLQSPQSTDGEVSLRTIERHTCVVGSFEIGLDEFEKSWTSLFIWMNEQGYEKAIDAPFEIYHNNFNEHPERKALVDFCIPVE